MQAPDFTLMDQNGHVHNLKDYAGKWLVLYFYPKDNTSGCTTEACSFRDGQEMIAQLGDTEIVGVSKDSVESHKEFAAKYHLNFTLLSDPTHETIEAYDAWGILGTKRNTVIINPKGQIVKKYTGVDPAAHVGQIIDDLEKLKKSA